MSTKQKPDMVNHPPHYKSGGIEVIDFLKAKLSPDEYQGFLKGNVLKYLARAGKKNKDDGGREDIKKAQWYMNKLAE